MAGRFVVRNGGKICGEKWREDFSGTSAGYFYGGSASLYA